MTARKTPDMLDVPDVFWLACELGYQLGVRDLSKLETCWIHRVNPDWTIAINAHFKPTFCEPHGCMGGDIPAGTLAVWWHGWLAGFINPAGGTLASHPEGANESRLVADLETAIDEAKGGHCDSGTRS
jgi:hypothetical protein